MNKNIKSQCPFGEHLQIYWDRRYDFFNRFDDGIKIDKEGLYSVKPECSALRIGQHTKAKTVFDAFGGIGGSAIGFARTGHKVICVECNKERLDYAKHNAEIYGVDKSIKFIHGDSLKIMESEKFDAVYFDPSWGGPEYTKKKLFPLDGFDPEGSFLIEKAQKTNSLMVFTVPINFDYNFFCNLHRDFTVLVDHLGGKPLYSTCFMDFRNY